MRKISQELTLYDFHPPQDEMTEPVEANARDGISRLLRPPITEVLCGLMFPAVEGLDAFEFGVYWDRHRDKYPGRQVQPAISDKLTLDLTTVQPTRAWLLSSSSEWIQQIQADRFYMNWRKRENGTTYPHFSDSGPTPGVKSRALAEFERLVEFCQERETISGIPTPTGVEIAKIDMFTRGAEWKDLEDLGRLLPVVTVFTELSSGGEINIALQVQETFPGGRLMVRLNSINGPTGVVNSVRLETRVVMSLATSDAEWALTEGNLKLNRMFFRLISEAEVRFGKKEK